MTKGIAHAEREHALLSPSASHRWIPCTPSARLEDTLPDTTSDAAKKGTLAHEISELKLRKVFVEPMGPRKFNAALKAFKAHPLYEPDMDSNTTSYLEYVQGIVHGYSSPPYIAIERRVDYDHIAPEGFGTSDCIIIGGKQLHVIDYKNGQGKPVVAENNPQMKLYALGALRKYSLLYEIDIVHLSIVQPKVWDRPSEWSLPVTDLLAWGESIKPIAALAFAGLGEYEMGDHCGFCRAVGRCPAQIKQAFQAADSLPLGPPPLASWEEFGEAIRKAEPVVEWYSKAKKLALAEILKGGELPGWKAVSGRGGREYVDIDVAFTHLKANGIDEALLYVREPLTPPALEKELGKKQYKELLEVPGHVLSRPGAPTLAPLEDKRPAFTGQIDPASVFGAPAEG